MDSVGGFVSLLDELDNDIVDRDAPNVVCLGIVSHKLVDCASDLTLNARHSRIRHHGR